MNICGFLASDCLELLFEQDRSTTKRLLVRLEPRFEFLRRKFKYQFRTNVNELFATVYLKLYDARSRNPHFFASITGCCTAYMKMIAYRWILDNLEDPSDLPEELFSDDASFDPEMFEEMDSVRIKRWKKCEKQVLSIPAYEKWQKYKDLKYNEGKRAAELCTILGYSNEGSLYGWVHDTKQKIVNCFLEDSPKISPEH